MKRSTRRVFLSAGSATLAALAVATLHSAAPSGGTVSKKDDVTWTGGPFTASNPIACAGSVDPSCDHYALAVDARHGTPVTVAIDGQFDNDDYDLFIYYPDGTPAAQQATGSGNEVVTFEHRTDRGSGPYEVRVQPFLVTLGSEYTGIAQVTNKQEIDFVRECLEPLPDSLSISGVTDTGQIINLTTLVLLDGIGQERGKVVMERAADAYGPVRMTLESRFRPVTLMGTDAQGLIDQAKTLLGGTRPSGVDIVYVLTNKNIQLGGNTAVAGLADCIGGVRFPETAFAVGEDITENRPIGPFVTTVNGTAVVAAHEIGHLMGAHHHYANCVQGVDPAELERRELTPCTNMFNAVNPASLLFSVVNTPVVRGHAVKYAAP